MDEGDAIPFSISPQPARLPVANSQINQRIFYSGFVELLNRGVLSDLRLLDIGSMAGITLLGVFAQTQPTTRRSGVDPRQVSQARKVHAAGLLSEENLERVMDARQTVNVFACPQNHSSVGLNHEFIRIQVFDAQGH